MTTLMLALATAFVLLVTYPGPAMVAEAGDITAFVTDQSNRPIEDAVVRAMAVSGATLPVKPARETVDQINKEFVPYVKAIVVESSVTFPNKDNIRHHVYSFSPAKTFELPLYIGTPTTPIVFDRPGVVTIGCNIHDWMIGYIYVAETPYVGKTGRDGRIRLENLPPGRYIALVWHPRLQDAEEPTRRAVTIDGPAAVDLAWRLTLKPELRPRRAPIPGQHGYR